MAQIKSVKEWLAIRKRLHAEERALAAAHTAFRTGEPSDLAALSVKHSEVRALRALAQSLLRRTLRKDHPQ